MFFISKGLLLPYYTTLHHHRACVEATNPAVRGSLGRYPATWGAGLSPVRRRIPDEFRLRGAAAAHAPCHHSRGDVAAATQTWVAAGLDALACLIAGVSASTRTLAKSTWSLYRPIGIP